MDGMTRRERRALRLRQWAMRAADHINHMDAADIRAKHLGGPCDYGIEFMGHVCRCGQPPITWEAVYAHVNATMGREGIA